MTSGYEEASQRLETNGKLSKHTFNTPQVRILATRTCYRSHELITVLRE